jgi:PAS domain S-box-containing protein
MRRAHAAAAAAHVREIDARNRAFVEQLPLVTYIEELDGASASYISPQIEALTGYTPGEWTADPDFFGKTLHPEDRDRVLRAFEHMHATGGSYECEYRLIARDGSVVWIRDGAVVVADDETGEPLYAQGFMVDISRQKHAETALRESEQRFRDLVSGIDAIVWEADPALNFTFVSKRAEDILGYPVDAWLAERAFITKHFHPDDRERVVEADREHAESGDDYELDYRVLAADGRTVWIQEIVRVEKGPDGRAARLRGVMIDVTEAKRSDEERQALEDQLRQAQKMEALGRLAGGIAHDFNNLLTVIAGHGGLAAGTNPDEPVRTHLQKIEAASQQAASLTQRLLTFSRHDPSSSTVVDVNAAWATVDGMLRRLIPADVELRVTTSGEVLPVETDPAALEQMLINLAINACDAMPEGGVLEVTIARDDDAVALTVADTGTGVSPEALPRIFEPFFTTKELGRGTGLGLSAVYGTVRRAGGTIDVASEPDRGSTFTVRLPLTTRDITLAYRPASDTARARGDEVALVVEDEPEVRALAANVLASAGYEVIAADGPAEALELAASSEFDLLLADVVMPGMRGNELARRLAAARPRLKVLLMSGYLDGERLVEAGRSGFVQKPFTGEELARAVRALLDAPGASAQSESSKATSST